MLALLLTCQIHLQYLKLNALNQRVYAVVVKGCPYATRQVMLWHHGKRYIGTTVTPNIGSEVVLPPGYSVVVMEK